MAIIYPKDTIVTRDMVHGWLAEFKEQSSSQDTLALRAFLEKKIEEMGILDTVVDTGGYEDLNDETPLVEMILMDLESYA